MKPIKLNTIELGVERIINLLSPGCEPYNKTPQTPECKVVSEMGRPIITEDGRFILCEKKQRQKDEHESNRQNKGNIKIRKYGSRRRIKDK